MKGGTIMIIYLYIKTHNKTGLKYFGKTISTNPEKYHGSGTYWKRHIEKHGYDVTTEIFGEYKDEESAKDAAIQFSIENSIVESNAWANLKLETLDGGWDHVNSMSKELRKEKFLSWWNSLSDEEKYILNSKKGHPGSKNFWFKKNRSGENNPRFNVHDDYATYEKISKANKNKMVVKDKHTNEIVGFIDKNHPNIKDGLWISVNAGKTHTEEFKKKRSEEYKQRGIKPPSSKGMLWWNNGHVVVRALECPGEEFIRGRKLKSA